MRLRVVAIALALLAGACGGGGDDDGGDGPAAPDPARDRNIADAAAFHLHDFPNGWQEIDFEALGAPPTMETLAQCLGETSEPSAQVVRGFRFGPGINQVAVSEVRVLRDADAARAEIVATTDTSTFVPCVSERVKGLLSTSVGEGLAVSEVTGTAESVSFHGASGVGVDMLARVQGPSGETPLYPSATFLQKGRAVAIITLISNNRAVSDMRRTLSAGVAGRLPVE